MAMGLTGTSIMVNRILGMFITDGGCGWSIFKVTSTTPYTLHQSTPDCQVDTEPTVHVLKHGKRRGRIVL